MSIVAAAIAAAGAIAGGVMSARAADKANASLQHRLDENEDWYNRRYNEDPTQRASAQQMITRTEEAIRKRNRSLAGRAAVMGSTNEAVAAEKEANADMMAKTVSQIAAAGDARKDAIERQYQATKAQLTGQQEEIERQKAATIGQATAGVASAAGNLPW
jgi:hypothetical protein